MPNVAVNANTQFISYLINIIYYAYHLQSIFDSARAQMFGTIVDVQQLHTFAGDVRKEIN